MFRRPVLLSVVTLLAAASLAAAAPPARDTTSWPGWGNSVRFDRYSPAAQINLSNVRSLRPVWSYPIKQAGGWEVTPIVAGGVLYAQDMNGTAFALDPESGRELWRFATGQSGRMRAPAWWPGDKTHGPRVIIAGNDRIYALDAATGKPAPGFGGAQGYINIRDGFAAKDVNYDITSPPLVYRNLLITGPGTQEFGAKGPPGDPRAYDVITGRLVWRFHTVPGPGERNAGSWGETGWKDRAGPSSWGMYSLDEKTGTVFIPVGNPADSYIGTDRPGDNLYSDSILALDAATGQYRWHYQMVHHDLFDYDDAAPPALIELTVAGKPIPALVEVTKQGLMFILDRRTGKPVFGVEERPVPASTLPGEQTSPTQPFPLKPPPLTKMSMTRADLSKVTPETKAYCEALWDRIGLRDTRPFEPPRLGGPNLAVPGNIGGLGGIWGGVSIDPRTNTIFVNTNNLPSYNYIVADNGASPRSAGGYRVSRAYIKLIDQKGMPCIQPPWGEMIAVGGNSGEILWRRPLGSAEMYGAAGAGTGLINRGGSLATAGGLVFMGGTADQPVLHAFNTSNGEEVWTVRLAAAVNNSPMTFVGKTGRQYLVVGTSGRADADSALIAFALPRPGDPQIDLRPAPPVMRGAINAPAGVPVPLRPEDMPPGPGRADLLAVCTACHALGTVTAERHTAADWQAIITDMRARGARMDEEAQGRIRDYLAAHLGAAVPREN
jgi:quinoprotein glucose dehydrogenase